MEEYRLGEPTIPQKKGYYICRGHMTDGSIHRKPKFVADFYVLKPHEDKYYLENHKTFRNLFVKSVRRFKKETDDEFLLRCSNKCDQQYIFYHYKDDLWCFDNPWWEYFEKLKMREKEDA
jgi:hypothetical protein